MATTTAAAEFPWDGSVLLVNATTYRLKLGERAALFCARRQKLYEMNPSADAIWMALAAEGSPAAAARALSDNGGKPAEVVNFVRQAALGWLRGGHLVPAEVLELLSGNPAAELSLKLDELCPLLRIHGDVQPDQILSVFGQFRSQAAASREISIVGAGGLVFMFEGRQPLGAWDEQRWIPELKARLTEQYTQAVSGAFLTHGALLSRGDQGLLLCGDPGAGKTTLTVALTAAGFQYHADDIVRIDEDGRVMGVPFSPALKSGAWAILDEITPDVRALSVYVRSDGQQVKYLPIERASRRPLPLAAVLLLARQTEGEARIEATEPLQVLTAILGSAYSARGSLDVETLRALADAANAARGGRLSYSNLDDAVRAIGAFMP